MKCCYINLDEAVDRRATMEEQFRSFAPPDWHLERFPARDTAYVRANRIPGSIRDAEKACFASHRDVIARSIETPTIIMEDDALIGPRSCGLMKQAIDQFHRSGEQDILFFDIGIGSISSLASLFVNKSQSIRRNTIELHILKH